MDELNKRITALRIILQFSRESLEDAEMQFEFFRGTELELAGQTGGNAQRLSDLTFQRLEYIKDRIDFHENRITSTRAELFQLLLFKKWMNKFVKGQVNHEFSKAEMLRNAFSLNSKMFTRDSE